MGLDFEYFINQKHITDLQKLKDNELYFIIRLFKDELEYFNNFDGFKLQGLIIVCNEMKDLIKDFRFILNGYMNIINENDLTFCSKTDIERLLSDMDKIENYLNRIKAIRLLKAKVNDLVDTCLLNIRMFYDFLNEFIYVEKHLWNAYGNKKELEYFDYMEQCKLWNNVNFI